MIVGFFFLDKEVVIGEWSCMDCICEKVINCEILLNLFNNGIMIKLGKWMNFILWDLEIFFKRYFEMVIRSLLFFGDW